ncbi:phage tail tape measure protein [Microbacterium aurugineum]|uniref:phage tail tape measure protein n=1 Tax=Microbacterium aurugineum TaxID=2851642 RepID=UPI0020BF0F48|nr:phage tail tape measure protein [Microbacterium aurugineum]MCK8477234.1 phage tail tape measure protein [Microbacterium aurugineum]
MADRVVKVRLLAEVADFKRGMEEAASETRKVGTASEQLAQKREAFNQLGVVALGVGTAMTAMTALSVKAAVGWESAWAGVTKTVEGTPAQLAAVEDGLRGLTSVLPASHDEIAAVAEAAGQLGIQTPNVVAFTRTMIDLGETTNLTANEAATSLARFMNIMGTSQDQVDNLGSALVGLGNNYATTEAEIVDMSLRLAGAGKQIGLTEGQVLGLSTALSSVGIEAEAGGSAMSKVMIDIAASVDEGGDRLELFAKTAGVSADTFAAKWKSDPAAALSLFVKGLANAESQGTSTLGVLSELGITEVRMRDALLRSASAADMFSDSMAMGNAEFEKNTALLTEAEKRYETVESQMKIAGNAINDAAISFGSVFLPAIAEAAGGVKEFAGFLADIPEPVQGIIAVLTGVVGVTALVGGAALVAVPKVVAFKIAMAELPGVTGAIRSGLGGMASFLGGPWGVAIVAATALMATYNRVMEEGIPSQDELTNKIKSTTDAAEGLAASIQKNKIFPQVDEGTRQMLEDLPALMNQAAEASDNWFVGLMKSSTASDNAMDAISRYGEALAGIAQTDLPSAQVAFRALRDEYKLTDEQARQLLDGMPAYRDEVLKLAGDQGIAADSTQFLKLAMGELPGSTAEAESALADMKTEATEADEALRGTAEALDEVAGTAMSMGEANDRALAAINSLTEAAEAEGVTLDGTNQASIRFRDSLRDVETAHRDSAQAILDNGGTLAQATEEWEKGRQKVIDMRVAKGEDIATATAWADKNLGSASQVTSAFAQVKTAIDNVPKKPVIDLTANTSAAYQAIMNIQSALRSVTGDHSIRVSTGQGGQGGLTFAEGGIVNGSVREFAAGDFLPGIYPAKPGGWHRFAEAGYDEMYGTTDPKYAARTHAVWQTFGDRMGFTQSAQQSSGPVRVSLAGAEFTLMVDGNPVRAIVQEQIVRYDSGSEAAIRGGVRRS